MRRLGLLLLAVVFLSSCHTTSGLLRPPLPEGGSVVLYVHPFSEEAERIRFHISEVVAQRADGREFPLTLALSEFSAGTMGRQRLVAKGTVPPGSYTGLAFRAHDALLKGETGESALLVAEGFVPAPFSFEAHKDRSVLLEGTFRFAESIRDGFSFTPVFTLRRPERPIAALMGYVANYRSNDLTVFNKKTGQVVDVIQTGAGPRGIALDQVLRRAYVVLADEDAVDVIDVAQNETIHRIELAAGDRPQEPALTRDGRLLVTANRGSDTVSIIDTRSFIELERIRVDQGPNSVLIDSSGKRAYVFNTLSDTISIIDLTARTVTAKISTDAGPLRGQLNRREDKLYVIHERSSYLWVIGTSNLALQQRIRVGTGASSLKVHGTTDRIYLGKAHDAAVSVYQPGLDIPFDIFFAGAGVSAMAIDGEESNLYLVDPQTKTLRAVQIVGNRMVMEFDVGEDAYWVILMGEM
ncbi:MAG: beta-propeller fold lactonase family protein [Nitrospirae bacterium]|nr:beta-propeller fold lactonase family protein [Nitrospirota bacterium]NTW65458.1 beta-propeller fold lactonase family protein [Nitrospirota bacterium]